MKDLKTLDFNEINEIIKNIKEPAYRAGQLNGSILSMC